MDRQEAWYLAHLPLRNQRIADVGANVGRLSQFFWDHGERSSSIVSIEPMPENAKAIERRIRAARAASKWSVKRCAISSRDGHLVMRRLSAPTRGGGLNAMVTGAAGDASGDEVTTACRTLEGLVPDATVIKVDVEGHEYTFLPQAVRALDKATAWALELHLVAGHPLEETLLLFAKSGYRLIGAAARRDDPDGAWIDVALTPEWTWDRIPGLATTRDGLPSTFKMVHVLAVR
jgi:FkbM family methyltransferase